MGKERKLTDIEKKSLSEALHNFTFDKRSKYKKLGAPETLDQMEEYKEKLLELDALDNLKLVIDNGSIVITQPDTSDTVPEDLTKKTEQKIKA